MYKCDINGAAPVHNCRPAQVYRVARTGRSCVTVTRSHVRNGMHLGGEREEHGERERVDGAVACTSPCASKDFFVHGIRFVDITL